MELLEKYFKESRKKNKKLLKRVVYKEIFAIYVRTNIIYFMTGNEKGNRCSSKLKDSCKHGERLYFLRKIREWTFKVANHSGENPGYA